LSEKFNGKMIRHENFIYEISIKKRDSGYVFAEVNRLNSETNECLSRVSYKDFSGVFDSTEQRFQKAHKWANNEIALLKKYEVGGEEYFSLKK
jgi:hypothetical protein